MPKNHLEPTVDPFDECIDRKLTPAPVASFDEWIARQLAAAPPLTDQQRTALAELLRPVRLTAAEWAGDPR